MKRPLLLLSLVGLLAASCSSQKLPELPDTNAPQFLPAALCYVDELVPGLRTDLKYSGCDNFVGRPIAGYEGHRAILRRDAALALKAVSEALAKKSYGLLIWDAYRPSGAMRDFYDWSRNSDDRMRPRFYPNLTKKGIYDGKYIGLVSEHSWALALDLTLIDKKTGRELDMGGHHDYLDPSSATDSKAISPRAQANRRLLCQAMEAAGYRNYSKEWWHYYYAPAFRSGTVFSYNFPLRDSLEQGRH